VTTHKFELFADYNQFYVWDVGADPNAPIDYTDEDVRNRVKVAPNVLPEDVKEQDRVWARKALRAAAR